MHSDFGTPPKLPQWALQAGLPAPEGDETFTDYVIRLGLDPEPLLDELNECTVVLANYRLATALQRAMPQVFDSYVAWRVKRHSSPERELQLEWIAASTFGPDARVPSYSPGRYVRQPR